MQTTLSGTTSYHTVVGNTSVPLGSWVQLTIRSEANAYDSGQAFLYVESDSGTQDFYIDDFTLSSYRQFRSSRISRQFSRRMPITFRSVQR